MENISQKSLSDPSHSTQGSIDEGISSLSHHQPVIHKRAGMVTPGGRTIKENR
jgi:hypothetical protein